LPNSSKQSYVYTKTNKVFEIYWSRAYLIMSFGFTLLQQSILPFFTQVKIYAPHWVALTLFGVIFTYPINHSKRKVSVFYIY